MLRETMIEELAEWFKRLNRVVWDKSVAGHDGFRELFEGFTCDKLARVYEYVFIRR